jgi:hypothetical protein
MEGRIRYLGRVERLRDLGDPAADIVPLYEATPDLWGWSRPIPLEEVQQAFPDVGRVSWPGPPAEAVRGSFWIFEAEPNSASLSTNSTRNQHRVVGLPIQALEVIDLDMDEEDDPDLARLWATEEGIELPFVPSSLVYLRAIEGWVGPVSLLPVPGQDVWRIPPDRLGHPLPVSAPAPTERTLHLLIDGHQRCILPPKVQAGNQVMQIDWAANNLLLRTVLRSMQRQDPKETHEFRQAREAISRLMEIGGPPTRLQQGLDRQRLRRTLSLAEEIEKDTTLREELLGELLAIRSVATAIEGRTEEAIRLEREQVREQLEAERRAAQQAKAEMEARVAQLRTEARDLEEQTGELRQKLEHQIGALDGSLQERIAELRARPEKVLAESMVLRAVLGLGQTAGSAQNNECTLRVPFGACLPWSAHEPVGAAHILNDTRQLQHHLSLGFKSRRLPTDAAAMVHAGFLSGALPILSGGGALEVLEAYAEQVAGARMLWLPITPATLEPHDLLGRADPATRRFFPAPGGLIDLLLEAPAGDELYLVVLDGINRAAAEAYLMPLLTCYEDAWRSGRRRSLALFHPSAVRHEDPYARAWQLEWPPNVLLAGTMSEGMATIPLPASLWDSAVLLHLDQFTEAESSGESSPVQDAPPTARAHSAVALRTWREWRSGLHTEEATSCGMVLRRIGADASLRATSNRGMTDRLLAALQEWRGESGHALEAAISLWAVPQAVAAGRAHELAENLRKLPFGGPRVERLLQLAGAVLAPLSERR